MPMFERKDCLSKKFFTKIAFIPLFTFLFVFLAIPHCLPQQ